MIDSGGRAVRKSPPFKGKLRADVFGFPPLHRFGADKENSLSFKERARVRMGLICATGDR